MKPQYEVLRKAIIDAAAEVGIPEGLFVETRRRVSEDVEDCVEVSYISQPRDGRVLKFKVLLDYGDEQLPGYVPIEDASILGDRGEYTLELDLGDGDDLSLIVACDKVDDFSTFVASGRDNALKEWEDRTNAEYSDPLPFVRQVVRVYAVGFDEAFRQPPEPQAETAGG